MLIRDVGLTDLDGLLGLYAELHPNDAPLPSRSDLELLWARIVGDPEQLYLGGFVDGTLVSACNAAIVPNLTRGARPYALIENVVTGASFRRRGLGSAVLKALIERCWARGCYKVMLMSSADRGEAHQFYESLGFDGAGKHAFVLNAR
jgi:GNAT superfamily N-acetyltransferase